MTWHQNIHLLVSAMMFVIVFFEGRNEDFLLRSGTAFLVALFWLPLLIVFAIWLAGDWIDGKLKRLRK